MNTASTTDPRAIADQAAGWLARLRAPDCGTTDRAGFEDWLARSPAHVEAYLEVERVDALAAMLASDDMLRAAARRARRSSGEDTVRRRWLPAAAAIAATLVLAVGAALWLSRPADVTVARYATAVGEQREVMLADGTAVLLDTGSALVTRFSDQRRRVELRRGRAQFEVAADPRRAFSVDAGAARIRDIGTTFQVSRRGGRVDVGLLDGVVVVTAGDAAGGTADPARRSTLAPGQQVTVGRGGTLRAVRTLDLAMAQGWPRGDLVFRNHRLDDLLAEMNRYSDTRLRLADPRLGEMRISGVFDVHDQPALVAALAQGWSLRPERVDEHEIVLHGPAG